jgi:hypothetical protein
MAAEPAATRDDELTTERIVDYEDANEIYVDGGGPGVGGVIVGIALLALVAIVAFFLLSSHRDNAQRTDAVTGAAPSLADTTAKTDQDVAALNREAAATVRSGR